MKKYVKNEDDSIDIIVSIKKDINSLGCEECDFKEVCQSRQFRNIDCLIKVLFGLKKEANTHHIEIVI